KPILIEGAIPLVAKPGSVEFDGYYAGQIVADAKKVPPGDFEYVVSVDVPDSNSESLQGKFHIVKSDPELDNTRPNLAAMRAMASDYDKNFELSIPKAVQEQFSNHLPKEGGVQKLAFRLT